MARRCFFLIFGQRFGGMTGARIQPMPKARLCRQRKICRVNTPPDLITAKKSSAVVSTSRRLRMKLKAGRLTARVSRNRELSFLFAQNSRITKLQVLCINWGRCQPGRLWQLKC